MRQGGKPGGAYASGSFQPRGPALAQGIQGGLGAVGEVQILVDGAQPAGYGS